MEGATRLTDDNIGELEECHDVKIDDEWKIKRRRRVHVNHRWEQERWRFLKLESHEYVPSDEESEREEEKDPCVHRKQHSLSQHSNIESS